MGGYSQTGQCMARLVRFEATCRLRRFRIFRKSWGNGYATESAMACLEYGINELNIKHIVGRVAIGNDASVRVLEKFEMTFWKNEFCHGMEVEYCIMPSVHS
jgi:RimJ/RimL family protein N-acetyltransferase